MRALAFLFLSIGIVLPAFAQDLGPEAVIGRMAQEALAAVKTDRQLAEQKIVQNVDFDEATRLAVGRAWTQASPAQREKLVREFRAMLVRTYANANELVQGETLRIFPARAKPQDGDATVRTQVMRAGGQALPIDFHVRRTAGGWKIYDIAVEGVSLVLTYRSEFDAVVKQAGIDGLIRRLGEKNRS
jgi:phospholipid transport system substrate-binding protein